MTLQLGTEGIESTQEAPDSISLWGQGVRIPSHRAKVVQLIVQISQAGENISNMWLDLSHTLQPGLQGWAALLSLWRKEKGHMQVNEAEIMGHSYAADQSYVSKYTG